MRNDRVSDIGEIKVKNCFVEIKVSYVDFFLEV